MSIESLFNHTVRIYRLLDALATRDDLGVSDSRPVAVAALVNTYNARPQQNWMGREGDRGPGEQQIRPRIWYLDKDLDVEERDIMVVTAGPEAGLMLRLLSVVRIAGYQDVHHIEASGDTWIGELA